MTHYDTLGVNQNASADDIKSAFRKLAGEHHPDRGGDQARFKEINEAYNTLRDPQTRAQYDAQMRGGFNPFGNHPGHQAHGNPFEFHFNMGGGHPFDMHEIFSQFGFANRAPQRNRNLRCEIELDFLETLNTVQKVIQYNTSQGPENLQIDIPAGVENNSMFTVHGRGDNAVPNIQRGNLEIIVRVRAHPRFQRNAENIFEDVTIDCFQAMRGTTLKLITPRNRTIELNIPAGTQNNSQFGVTDEGFPRHNGTLGKYIVRVNVLIPTALTREQLALVDEILKIRPINT